MDKIMNLKIGAFRQIEMNLDRMCEYIIRELRIEF